MPAVATLTYVYADSTAVLGPLALSSEPGNYDLCATHTERTSAPQGWEVIRLPITGKPAEEPASDDLLALADAVRAIGLRHDEPEPDATAPEPIEPAPLRQVGHLRLVSSQE